jgi:hypothetical protein
MKSKRIIKDILKAIAILCASLGMFITGLISVGSGNILYVGVNIIICFFSGTISQYYENKILKYDDAVMLKSKQDAYIDWEFYWLY